jgi:hypothetical protein
VLLFLDEASNCKALRLAVIGSQAEFIFDSSWSVKKLKLFWICYLQGLGGQTFGSQGFSKTSFGNFIVFTKTI